MPAGSANLELDHVGMKYNILEQTLLEILVLMNVARRSKELRAVSARFGYKTWCRLI